MLKHSATLLISFLLANCASRTFTFEVPPGYVFKLRLSQNPVLGERVRTAVQLISVGDTLFSGELPESGPAEFPLHIMFVTARDPCAKSYLIGPASQAAFFRYEGPKELLLVVRRRNQLLVVIYSRVGSAR
jgi:hypothetical protein